MFITLFSDIIILMFLALVFHVSITLKSQELSLKLEMSKCNFLMECTHIQMECFNCLDTLLLNLRQYVLRNGDARKCFQNSNCEIWLCAKCLDQRNVLNLYFCNAILDI